jgi:hypothetical protein
VANKIFAEHFISGTQQSVFKKRYFIRSEWKRREKYFTVCRGENEQQTRSLLCVLFPAHDKVFLKMMLYLF